MHSLDVSLCTMTDLSSIPFHWVDSDEALEKLVDSWVSLPYIILDTEFERTNTFFAKAGLIQIAADRKVYLIDPLAVSSLLPLARVLSAPSVEIVLHSMSEDVDLLSHVCQCRITSVFDSQVAAGFLGEGLSMGYQRLVESVLGVALDKGETRSDWLRRPLSDKQLHYAAADVFYLEDIYLKLRQRLIDAEWFEAVMQDCEAQVAAIGAAYADPEHAYLKLRGAWDLPLERQRVLQQLVLWRDDKAIRNDLPKSWVFSDAQLIEVARTRPESLSLLHTLPKIKPKSVRLYGEELLTLVSAADVTVPEDFVAVDRPIKGRELDFFKQIKKVVAKAGADAGIEPQLIAGRKQMESWVIHFLRANRKDLPTSLSEWRKQLIGKPLLALLPN